MKIVFLDEYTVSDSDLTPIKALGDYIGYDNTPPELVVERSREADVVITNKTPLKGDTLRQLPNLKLICIAATGMNNVDLETAGEMGIPVKNAVGYSTDSVAEHTFCGALALYKQLIYLDDFVKDGSYSQCDKLFNFDRPTYELSGKNWGIIGLGNIGRRVGRIARVFDCEVAYYSTSGRNDDKEFTRMQLNELLQWCDILSIHAPLSRDTYHILDYHQFSLMKKNAIVVNVARGSLINEDGLARAINEGLIAGAALDVYSAEPIRTDNPINTVKDKYKLVLTPHSAWSTKEALQTLVGKVAENIKNFLGDSR